MRKPHFTRKIFVFLLIPVWLGYAFLNLLTNGHYVNGVKFAEVSRFTSSNVALQQTWQNIGGFLTNFLGKTTSNNMRLLEKQNHKLIPTNFYPYETFDFKQPSLRMQQLQIAAKEQGISLLFLNCLSLNDEDQGYYGALPLYNDNSLGDAFIYTLHGYNVEYLDARTSLKQSSLPPSEYRYKTEPHWTTQASFVVYQELLAKLKKQGSKIDPAGFYANQANFSQSKYEQSFVGKLGKLTGIPFSGSEDFTLILPNFATDFTVTYVQPGKSGSLQGDFSQVILNKKTLAEKNPYVRDMYSAYLQETYPLRIIQNNLNPAGPKILIIGDSYMLPLTAFLSTAASQIHLLWPYSLPENEENLIQYIANKQIDHIVIGLSPSSLNGNGLNFLDGIEIPTIPQ